MGIVSLFKSIRGISKHWWWLVLFAFGLRVLAAGLLYHTDVKAIYRDSTYIENGIVAGYLRGIAEDITLPYPPAVYVMFNTHKMINGWMFSDYYDSWMNDGGPFQTINHASIYRDLLAMKIPMLVADILIGVLLMRIVETKQRMKIAALWWLNPVSIYAIYGVGNFDVIPTLSVMLGIWAWHTKRWNWGYVAIGLAAGFKVWPLLLLPFMIILDHRGLWKRGLGLVVSGSVFLAMLAPILRSVTILKSVFLSNLTSGLFQAVIPLGDKQELPIFFVIYWLLWVYILIAKKQVSFAGVCVMVIGMLFGVSHFHPQWIVWMLPMFVLLVVQRVVSRDLALVVSVSYFGTVLLIEDKFVSLGMFKAVNNAFDTIESTRWWLDYFGVGFQVQGVFHALFLGSMIFMTLASLQLIKLRHVIMTFNLRKMLIGWVAGVVLLFVIVHVPLVFMGRYFDSFYGNDQATLSLYADSRIAQNVEITQNGWSGLEIRLKNINYRNTSPLLVRVTNQGEVIREVEVPGQIIGDDFNLSIAFERILDSEGNTYLVTFESPETESGNELVFPYDPEGDTTITVGTESVRGRLTYATFVNPGGLFAHLSYSLGNVARKW